MTLTPTKRRPYEAERAELWHVMDIARRGRNTAKGRATLLRFRQKPGRWSSTSSRRPARLQELARDIAPTKALLQRAQGWLAGALG